MKSNIWRLIRGIGAAVFVFTLLGSCQSRQPENIAISKVDLLDKIKGAWAAQTIGVTYGSPVEFKFNSAMVPDSVEINWYDGYLKDTYDKSPGYYDDIYMDLTFIEVFENEGLDAPAESFAKAYAYQDYSLWFAN